MSEDLEKITKKEHLLFDDPIQHLKSLGINQNEYFKGLFYFTSTLGALGIGAYLLASELNNYF